MLAALKAQTGVRLAGINQKDAPQNAMAFLTELGNPYDAIGVDANGRTSIDWGVYGVPETFVVNAEGVITYKHIGPITAQSLAAEVLPAIEKAKGG
jgi:cytochrome c biogenesis protein CcmG/thiol:disulfide interchange protein DsbE